MDKVKVCDLDFVYISFKEPNKEENWADLKNKVPWAKRVDGVVGFDSAHKAAAELAETDFFISVDGDNILHQRFLLQSLDFSLTNPNAVHRWRAENSVNGLIYGNGGLVGWPKQTCLNMKTHENADNDENQIDFCWGVPHENLWNCYSTTVVNSSTQQAFVAGYREGVKMSLDKGKPMSADIFRKRIWSENLRKLCTWMSVGADTEHGQLAMLGARMGCYDTMFGDHDLLKVRELDQLEKIYVQRTKEIDINEELLMYGESLRQRLDIPVAEYDSNESKFFKYAMPPHKNMGVQTRER
tara:strand:+ start:4325 stop:5218 length:894 start_codon:yes stop_codon:yes gene_type:complete